MIIINEKQNNYELIDSGDGMKLERYGPYVFSRPDPQALWTKLKDSSVWQKSDLKFTRQGKEAKWVIRDKIPKEWQMEYGGYNFVIRPTSFKHTGLFPEQLANWQWIEEVIKKAISFKSKQSIKVLNLFAYTGGATLACAKAGAEVCHVDASKQAVSWARTNAKISGLENNHIRWIVDDVMAFIKREIKRGNKYDAIIMDPPSFGHGPKDELWKIEENFLDLLNLCKNVLSDDPLFILMNGYAAGYSSLMFENNLKWIMEKFKGKIEKGELAIRENSGERLLPCGIFARWKKE